ncbi:Uncharacterised protein [Enterobacter hormaechei]|nr:Uncharacterised protein [Enterobacter hormaechei]
MEVRETLQNGTVYRRRGDSREAITRATFTGFENRYATFFGRLPTILEGLIPQLSTQAKTVQSVFIPRQSGSHSQAMWKG